jgi:putative transposase
MIMANTYSQVSIHAVFTVRGRENGLSKEIRERLFKYTSGTLKAMGIFPLAVNGCSDHVHIFFELPTNISIAKFLQKIKSNSSRWINDQQLIPGKFSWQKGFGAFSHSRSQKNKVIKYIINQETHHAKTNFRDEYLNFLSNNEIEFNNNYLFEFYVV